jgi:hypothetical protein
MPSCLPVAISYGRFIYEIRDAPSNSTGTQRRNKTEIVRGNFRGSF